MKACLHQLNTDALDYLVARALWPHANLPADWFIHRPRGRYLPSLNDDGQATWPVSRFRPCEDWHFSGPVLQAHEVFPFSWREGEEAFGAELARPAMTPEGPTPFLCTGPTPLMAAWRCLVGSRLGWYEGEELMVEVPDELLAAQPG